MEILDINKGATISVLDLRIKKKISKKAKVCCLPFLNECQRSICLKSKKREWMYKNSHEIEHQLQAKMK